MAENIAFSDWSEKLDTAGTKHWLPAYGLQQPSIANGHLQQNDLSFDSGPHDHTDYFDDNNDDDFGDDEDCNWSSFNQNGFNGNDGRSSSYICLETIVEETSDDLRTESEQSSDEDFLNSENWSVKNRDPFNSSNSKKCKVYDNNDPGVHDDDDDDAVFYRDDAKDQLLWTTVTSCSASGLTNGCEDIGGAGSLLQFESLEKQCEQTLFRTTATATPFTTNSDESLNSHRPATTAGLQLQVARAGRHGWRQQAADDDDGDDDDEAALNSTPFSSYAGDGSSSVKSLSRSMESVHSAASRKRCNRDGLLNDVSLSLEDLRRCVKDDGSYRDPAVAACPAQPAAGVIYKTVDCLTDPSCRPRQETADETDGRKPEEECVAAQTGCCSKLPRSSENLSEDSGFGDQVPRGAAVQNIILYKPIVEDENYFEMSTKSIATTAALAARSVAAEKGLDRGDGDDDESSKFSAAWHSYPDLGERPSVTAESPTTDDDNELHHHHHHRQDGTMASRLPVSSTPNLCSADGLLTDDDTNGLHYMRSKKLLLDDSTTSLYRSHSLKRIHYESESALSAASSRGSNLLITTSFVSLAAAPTPNKGVHFCPVVSEVNWRESFSSSSCCTDANNDGCSDEPPPETEDDDDDDYDRISDEADENIDTMVMKLLTGLPSEKRRPSVAEKQHLRERLDFITGGSPPLSHRIGGAAPTGAAAAACSTTGSAVPPVVRENDRRRSVQSRPAERGTTTASSSLPAMSGKSKSIGGKLGGFFQRFSLRRLSGRRNKDKKKKEGETVDRHVDTADASSFAAGVHAAPNNCRPDTPPPVSGRPSTAVVADRGKKPPLPPQPPSADGYATRRRLLYDESRCGRLPPSPALPPAGSRASLLQTRSSAAVMARPDHRAPGLLETDLDSNVTRTSSSHLTMGGGGPCNKKTRSLLDLGASSGKLSLAPSDSDCRSSADGPSSNTADYRAKSMEFLLDKENQAAVQAPENELRKVNVNGGDRILSEHELRVQRSLQRLNLPEWYKTCNVPAQGFLLKRNSDAGYTTSMSSLSSNQSHSAKTYTNNNNNTLLSPQTHAATKNFSRWSTSRLNGSNSNSTSPCSSTRSSFNYRQPYLGWRSQEKLSKPRTPAERLAAGLLAQQQHEQTCQTNLSEVQSSIKEVTSAIANYVSSSTPDGSKERLNTDHQETSSRCSSFKGSTGRLCWLESSFVGNKRPSLTRDTPPFDNTSPSHRKSPSVRQTQNSGSWVNDRPSPGSTTMDDVLNSLLGLQRQGATGSSTRYQHRGNSGSVDLRKRPYAASVTGNAARSAAQKKPQRSENGGGTTAASRGSVRCRYSECQRAATASEARRTFKTCHNCNHVYCSRRCRRAHWQNHRKTCLDRRTATLCQSIVDAVLAHGRRMERLSAAARRGYLSHGRGAVKCHFSGVELADRFVRSGGDDDDDAQCEPAYAKWTDLDPELDELRRLCKTYDPDTRFVLHVSVCVQSEVPGPGPVRWERHLVYKCVALRLRDRPSSRPPPPSSTDKSDRPDTLILTSLPGHGRRDVRTARRVCFANVQSHLRRRGVELRQQFPDVYQKLCRYVDGDVDATFTPVAVYPRDKASGKTFMCVIMPDAEPDGWSDPDGGGTVETIDVGRESAAAATFQP